MTGSDADGALTGPTDHRTGRHTIVPPHGYGRISPWQKGQSGNPAGYSGAYNQARAICAKATAEAARKQVELMDSDDERVAFMATEAVLNRGAGKPRDHSNEDDAAQRIDISALSGDERASLAVLLRKALGIQ